MCGKTGHPGAGCEALRRRHPAHRAPRIPGGGIGSRRTGAVGTGRKSVHGRVAVSARRGRHGRARDRGLERDQESEQTNERAQHRQNIAQPDRLDQMRCSASAPRRPPRSRGPQSACRRTMVLGCTMASLGRSSAIRAAVVLIGSSKPYTLAKASDGADRRPRISSDCIDGQHSEKRRPRGGIVGARDPRLSSLTPEAAFRPAVAPAAVATASALRTPRHLLSGRCWSAPRRVSRDDAASGSRASGSTSHPLYPAEPGTSRRAEFSNSFSFVFICRISDS